MVEYALTVPISSGCEAPVIAHASQYDDQSREFHVKLIDENGAEYEIPSGASVTVRGTKPDHTGFSYPCTYSGSTVTFSIQKQMTVCAGKIPLEIEILDADSAVLNTADLMLSVKPSALSDDTKVSDTDLPLIEQAAQAVPTIKAAVENATSAADAAAKSEASAAESEANAKTSASEAEASNQTATSAANAAKASETNAASSETNAKASETAAKTSAANAATSEANAESYADAASNSASAAAESAKSVDTDSINSEISTINGNITSINSSISSINSNLVPAKMGWKKTTASFSNGVATIGSCSGATSNSVVLAARNGNYSDTSGLYGFLGAAAASADTIKVFTGLGTSNPSGWTVNVWWTK